MRSRNGAKSRGPVTLEGKTRSRYNALRHGFTSHRAVLLDTESEAELESFSQIYFDRFLPAR